MALAALPLRDLSLASNAFKGSVAAFGQATAGRRRRLAATTAISFGQLTSLSLAGNGLDGTLSSAFFSLTNLVSLDLSNNAIRCARERARPLAAAPSTTR